MKVGIIGNGFVGNAIYNSMKDLFEVFVYDNNPSKCYNNLDDINRSEIIFICVPTPTTKNGKIDISIIESVVSQLENNKTLVIKSTITPHAVEKIILKFPKQSFVINPEFLTERTALQDFLNPSRIILGGKKENVEKVKNIYVELFPDVKYICTDAKTASFIKYFSNCFYASKISLMNEFKQICDKENLEWNTALEGLLSSGWVNPMHTLVPGTDGKLGFGGKCFPKDMYAFIDYAMSIGVEPKMLLSAQIKNLEIRENQGLASPEDDFSLNKEGDLELNNIPFIDDANSN